MTNPNDFDRFLARKLAGHTRLVGRRLFLSKLTRNVFAVAGVAIAAKAGLYEIGRLRAGSVSQNLSAPPANVAAAPPPNPEPWNWCALHGKVCGTGTCTGGTSTTGPNSQWVACCLNTSDNKWHCCHYVDQCGPLVPTYKDCQGTDITGLLWCIAPDGQRVGNYYCTVITCETPGSATDSGCTCTEPSGGAYPAC